jgi:hypothetical protein
MVLFFLDQLDLCFQAVKAISEEVERWRVETCGTNKRELFSEFWDVCLVEDDDTLLLLTFVEE